MKAVVCTRYGPPEVLELREVPKPVPGDAEVLIKIHATTVAAGDVRTRAFKVPLLEWLPARLYLGVTRPKRPILGLELAGDVAEVGKDATRFKPGDPVFAFAGFGFGAYAEYLCLPEESKAAKDGLVAIKPSNMTYAEAAAATGGALTALSFMRKAGIQGGQRVLIYGASGSIGTFAVQLATAFGAEVTGVCSTANVDLVRALGADKVVDYAREDFTTTGETYDVIFDAVAKSSQSHSRRALKEGGIFLSAHGSATVEPGDLMVLKDLIEAGKLRSVIDRSYPLEQIVEAHRYVEQGHKQGNVVITVD
jgi:NADPH:quinone reductase-like Zn-dependent oxidoreductase